MKTRGHKNQTPGTVIQSDIDSNGRTIDRRRPGRPSKRGKIFTQLTESDHKLVQTLNSSEKKPKTTTKPNEETIGLNSGIDSKNVVNIDLDKTTDEDSDPPQLFPQVVSNDDIEVTSVNQTTDQCPVETSGAKSAEYLQKCQHFSEILKNWKTINTEELMTYLKYALIKRCSGDIDLAIKTVGAVPVDIQKGSVYIIEHPINTSLANTSRPNLSDQRSDERKDKNWSPAKPFVPKPNYDLKNDN